MSQLNEDRRTVSGFELLYVRGFPFPGLKGFYKENIEAALDFQPRDTDIFICAYPKSGTNWMKVIVHSILNHGQKPLESTNQLTYEAMPFLDMSGPQAAEGLPDPRAFQYHVPYWLMPMNPKAKYIYIFRDPKDTLVSFYHFTRQTDQMDTIFDEYFETFMKGVVSFGDYFDHVLSWYEHRNEPNVLFITYEQLHANTAGQVLRIAKFLGQSYHDALQGNKPVMELVMKQISFGEMKKTLMKEDPDKKEYDLEFVPIETPPEAPGPRYGLNQVKFFRKGIVGDWKNHFSAEQSHRMEERITERFGNTDIVEMLNP